MAGTWILRYGWLKGLTSRVMHVRTLDPETGEPNQRQNSFIIPQGVQIFGGFSGEENYSYGLDKLFNKGELNDLKEVVMMRS